MQAGKLLGSLAMRIEYKLKHGIMGLSIANKMLAEYSRVLQLILPF